jgi:hypothetical protein
MAAYSDESSIHDESQSWFSFGALAIVRMFLDDLRDAVGQANCFGVPTNLHPIAILGDSTRTHPLLCFDIAAKIQTLRGDIFGYINFSQASKSLT